MAAAWWEGWVGAARKACLFSWWTPVQPSSELGVMQRLKLSLETLLAWRLIGITKSIRVAAKGHNLRLISLLGRLIKCYQLMALVKGDTC